MRAKLPPQVILLGFAALLNDAASEIIYPLLPLFLTTQVGATPLVVGMIEGGADALASFLKLGAGWWSDRVPRRKPFVVGGYLLAALSRALIAIATFWPAILAARLIDRTGKGIRSAPRDAIISDITPREHHGRAYGLHRALDHTGAVIGPLIAFALLGWCGLDLREIFMIAVIPGLIAVALLLFALRETPREIARPDDRLDIRVKMPRAFWSAIGSIGLFSLANASDAFLLLQASAAGVAMQWLPLLWAAHHVVKSLFTTKAGEISDRVGRRRLLIAGWLVYAAIYLLFPFAGTLPIFLTLFILYAIPFTLTEGAERAWVAGFAPDAARGRAFGAYYLVTGLCTLAGTALFGWLYQTFAPITAFHAAAGFAILAAISVAVREGDL